MYLIVRAARAAEVDDLDVGAFRMLQQYVLRLEVAVDYIHLWVFDWMVRPKNLEIGIRTINISIALSETRDLLNKT